MAGTMANKAKRLWLRGATGVPRYRGLSGELAKRRTKILWLYYESGGHSAAAPPTSSAPHLHPYLHLISRLHCGGL